MCAVVSVVAVRLGVCSRCLRRIAKSATALPHPWLVAGDAVEGAAEDAVGDVAPELAAVDFVGESTTL